MASSFGQDIVVGLGSSGKTADSHLSLCETHAADVTCTTRNHCGQESPHLDTSIDVSDKGSIQKQYPVRNLTACQIAKSDNCLDQPPGQSNANVFLTCHQRSPKKTKGIQRRLWLSLDDKTVVELQSQHWMNDVCARHLGSSEQSTEDAHDWLRAQVPAPAEPPFAPPVRAPTPEDILGGHEVSESSSIGCVFFPVNPRVANVKESVVRLLRRGAEVSTNIRRLFSKRNGPAQLRLHPISEAVRPSWRPPISGHSTFRHDEITMHPFHNISSARPDMSPASFERGPEGSGSQKPAPRLADTRNVNVGSHGSDPALSQPTLSQRYLSSLVGTAIPVTNTQLQGIVGRRSATLPNSVRRSTATPSTRKTETLANGTIRTIDLIEAFPAPPISDSYTLKLSNETYELAVSSKFVTTIPSRQKAPLLNAGSELRDIVPQHSAQDLVSHESC